jgi:tubulin-specific chaperone A
VGIEAGVSPITSATFELDDDRSKLSPGDRSVLIIEDDSRFAAILADIARERGFKVLIAGDGESGLYLADYYQPSGIVLDIGLPGMDGWQVMDRLKDESNTRHIPVHFMSGNEQPEDALKHGAVGFLTKPVSIEQIESALGRIEHIIDRPVKRLLLVEDNLTQLQSIRELIGDDDVETSSAQSGEEALALLKADAFDCIVLDLGLPDIDGFELLETIRKQGNLEYIPVVIYTGRDLDAKERAILDRYAQSVIVKDVRSPERLLDDTTLFLHRVESKLSEEHQRTIRMLHDRESLFEGRKVLVVDDDMRNVFALSAALQEKQMEVLVANDGYEALDQLEQHPDTAIVLMDIMMPKMDGYEAMQKIREQTQFTALPIVALTAKAMKGDRKACIEAGANDYLAKPIETEKMLSMMRVWLYR